MRTACPGGHPTRAVTTDPGGLSTMGASGRVEIQRRLRGHRPPCTPLRHNSPTRNKHLKNCSETDRPGLGQDA